ncbi:MAG: hypothetical protein LBJ82_04510, partial [Deltaproteobacteria bacterium]|nr:hypothetical protein [Deltaproteobacteria bacterium]
MTCIPTLTKSDILLIVQSLAQIFSGRARRPAHEISLFLRINSLEGWERTDALAAAALGFFDLDAHGPAGAALKRELVSRTDLASWADI